MKPRKVLFILLNILMISMAGMLLFKKQQSQLDGIIFVMNVLALALLWKRVARKKKQEYAKSLQRNDQNSTSADSN